MIQGGSMNIAVGKVTDAARAAIEGIGGHIEKTLKEGVVMTVLPESAEIASSTNEGSLIHMSDGTSLYFRRAWHTEDCILEMLGE